MDPDLRAEVRRRAGFRCEYCLLPEEYSDFDLQVDHIISEKHDGPTTLENLALACIHCNAHKGPNVAGVDPLTRQIWPLFNPRTDSWNDHFEWQGALLAGRTARGRATVHALRINRHDRAGTRALLLAAGVRFSLA
jgi:hypothetical protein